MGFETTHVMFSKDEQWFIHEGLIDDALVFFNDYFKFKEHPFTKEDAFVLGNFQLSLKLESVLYRSLKMPESEYYRMNPMEFWKNLIKTMTQTHYVTYMEFINNIIRLRAESVLDFGGGSGYLSYLLSQFGFNVTYSEVNLLALSWMRFLRAKYNLRIDIIDLYTDKITKKYDVVICKDVVEHTENPKEMIDTLLSYSNKKLLFCPDKSVPEDWLPMHREFSL